jgi:hypothetical protein
MLVSSLIFEYIFKFVMKKIEKIIHVCRHGARTSSSVGRKEDFELSNLRKGLTPFGFFQFYEQGLQLTQDNFFKEILFDKSGHINIHCTNYQRTIDSSQALVNGIIHGLAREYQTAFCPVIFKNNIYESKFVENLFKINKFNSEEKYSQISKLFPKNLNNNADFSTYSNSEFLYDNLYKINLKQNSDFFEKKLSKTKYDTTKIHNLKNIEFENIFVYLKYFTPYFKEIFLNEISSGVYDFDLKKNVNIEYFRLLEDGLLTIKQVKNFIDFIRCNKFYEDLQIYSPDYEEFIYLLKNFLINYYHYRTTINEEINLYRLKNFFKEMIRIVESENKSINYIINHNSAIRIFIHFLLNEEVYKTLSLNKKVSDDDFFMICPKFAGRTSFYITEERKIFLEINGRNETSSCKQDILGEGGCFIDYKNFKKFLIDIYKEDL